MTSLLDGQHPVAGNRRFGIFPDASGGYTFFILGVDRIWNWYTSVGNWVFQGAGFEKSDALWTNIQTNLKTYVTTYPIQLFNSRHF